jgi:hypothetical protein
MLGLDSLAATQIGDRTRNAQRTVLAARAQQAALASVSEHPLAAPVQLDVLAKHGRVHLRIHEDPRFSQPGRLAFACLDHLLPGARRARRGRARQVIGRRALHARKQVDTVEQRPTQAAAVAGEVGFAAPAALVFARISAQTRIGGGQQHEPRRVDSRVACSHDRHPALLQRLAQRIESRARELGQLVE